MVKPSKYNFLFTVDDKAILAYNSLTSALVELTPQEYRHLREFLNEGNVDFFEARGLADFGEQLAEVGVVVADDQDELEQMKAFHAAARQQDRHAGLTIIPTLNCNLRCGYCLSYANTARMEPETQQALLGLADQMLQRAESLSVTWYGGEPTLCLDIIEKLSPELRALCETSGASERPASIVTNGYLLTAAVASRLRDQGIAKAQVTLDGDRLTHDERRPHRSGRGTFDRILDNIAAACDIIEIHVRINVDRTNAQAAIGAIDALAAHGLQGKVFPYFGHVQAYTEACADVAGSCLTVKEFSELDMALTKQAVLRGFSAFRSPEPQLGGVCRADRRNSYVVAPEGLLYKCWAQASLGPAYSVGTVFDSRRTATQTENLRRFLEWDPFEPEECHACRFLPICMGGCPHLRMLEPATPICSGWRYNLLEVLGIRYEAKERLQRQHSESTEGQIRLQSVPEGRETIP